MLEPDDSAVKITHPLKPRTDTDVDCSLVPFVTPLFVVNVVACPVDGVVRNAAVWWRADVVLVGAYPLPT